ncbi:family 78 glycoside hydrolase catalytic domain [Sphingomonas sp. JC676]|uniref:family 78 glycoside hydrolase catalytic domain n=1 Tax=Sphingomonas sp. JC676 TaxID=2768065 RepID=UPI001657ED11|nr:family 78 glycoside hydrolase catalytic domain [Sphingomonas sp. JC676]MBC9032006.1 family 78 glycoside hydrolase catalytic domain [Sphingomonas sp. JC676]
MTAPRLTRRGLMAATLATSLVPKAALAAPGSVSLRPARPRVEWRAQPEGIDMLRPRFGWTAEAVDPAARGLRQTAWRIVVASTEADVTAGRGDIWDSGKIKSAKFGARLGRDLRLGSQRPYWWSLMLWDERGRASQWSAPERFFTGVIGDGGWKAKWIAAEPGWPIRIAESRKGAAVEGAKPMPLFRRGFAVRKPVRHAILSISGLGHYVASINGHETTQSMLNPGWTDYRKTVLYNSYDVADLLQPGANAIGVMLGNGMYNVEGVKDRYKKFVGTFGQPKLIAQLAITYTDGTRELIVSDESWVTRPGPITFSSIYGGEDHDAQREIANWNRAEAATEGWSPVLLVDGPPGRLKAQGIPPMTVDTIYPTVRITEPKPGVFVYDFGKNAASRLALKVRGPAGATIRLSPSEVLGSDGLIAPRSIGARPGLPVYYAYTLAGRGEEVWRPRFMYCGSRYLQVEGAVPAERAGPNDVAVVSLASEFVHTDLRQSGRFESSQELLVQVHDLIKQAVLSNSASVFTDCPHREKLGWLEQDQLNAETVLYIEDGVTLYEKTIADIVDAQLPSGQIPEIAPEFVQFLGVDEMYRDSPEWGGAVVIAAWKTYRMYGDPSVLESGYPAMRRYADHIEGKRTGDGLVVYGLGDWLDLGPRAEGKRTQLTTMGVTATATYYQMLTCLVEIARLLGRPAAEVADFQRRAANVKAAFNAAYFHADKGSYDTGSQTANAMPLALGMVPAGQEKRVLASLVADIRSRGDHVSAGDIGFHYVVRALAEHGAPEVLHGMLSRTDAPSYGAQVMAGATALTENWDPKLGGSQNHFMLGHALAWLYIGLAGIKVDFWNRAAPAITIAPQTVPGLESAGASYDSVLGPIRSAWRRQGMAIRFEIEVPPGAQAVIRLPVPLGRIRESGAPARSAAGVVKALDMAGTATLIVGSGRYVFEAAAA